MKKAAELEEVILLELVMACQENSIKDLLSRLRSCASDFLQDAEVDSLLAETDAPPIPMSNCDGSGRAGHRRFSLRKTVKAGHEPFDARAFSPWREL